MTSDARRLSSRAVTSRAPSSDKLKAQRWAAPLRLTSAWRSRRRDHYRAPRSTFQLTILTVDVQLQMWSPLSIDRIDRQLQVWSSLAADPLNMLHILTLLLGVFRRTTFSLSPTLSTPIA